jgi:hypothetical protein
MMEWMWKHLLKALLNHLNNINDTENNNILPLPLYLTHRNVTIEEAVSFY